MMSANDRRAAANYLQRLGVLAAGVFARIFSAAGRQGSGISARRLPVDLVDVVDTLDTIAANRTLHIPPIYNAVYLSPPKAILLVKYC